MGRPCGMPEPWIGLVGRLGSVQAVAEALLTTPRTVRRWAYGVTKPSRQAQALIDSLISK